MGHTTLVQGHNIILMHPQLKLRYRVNTENISPFKRGRKLSSVKLFCTVKVNYRWELIIIKTRFSVEWDFKIDLAS